MSIRAMIRYALIVGTSAAAVVIPSGVALGSASVIPFTFSTSETFADAPPECMPVVKEGVTTATDTGSGQATVTANGFAVHFTDEFVYRTSFPDGSYLSGTAVGHHTSIGKGDAVLVSHDVVQERRTIFGADNTPIGSVIIHALTHTTVNALTGEASASIDRFFFTCH
jgi:hypothetical protein